MEYFRDFALFKNYFYLNAGDFAQLLTQYQTPDRIPGLDGKKSIVIDVASDPWNLNWIKDLVAPYQESGIISAILINDKKFAEQNHNFNFRFFPVWAYRCAELAQQYRFTDFFSHRRTHNVSCLNRMPKIDRAYIYYLLNQLSWRNEIFLSFAGLTVIDGDSQGKITIEDIKNTLGSVVAEFLISELSRFPLSSEKNYQQTNCHRFDSPAYIDCYSNLCTESGITNFCPTEKTFKCIVSGTLIFPWANTGFVESMHDLGLDIDYPGLNLHTIDSIQTWKSRAETIVNLLDQCYNNIQDIWHNNRDQLQYNQQILISKKIDDIILPNVQDHIC
jgi:hypothetical protein